MNVYQYHVTDYIKCPYLYGRNMMSSSKPVSKSQADHMKFKTHLTEIASYEMKNDCKLSLHEYRVRYTNKFYSDPKQVIGMDEGNMNFLIAKLNNIFSVFADSAFFGYNIPIEIAIPGSTVTFKDTVDFGLIDDQKNVTFVNIESLDDEEQYKQMLKHWVHYYITYSYLAHSFGRKINIIVLDPIRHSRIDMAFLPERFDMDLARLTEIVKPMSSGLIYKNLFMCNNCNLVGECK